MVNKVRSYTAKVEPWWTIIGAPLSQEIIFRLLPYQLFYLSFGRYWEIGISSSILYALIHWYFGIRTVLGTFLLGLVLWYIMVTFGLLPAILAHSLNNVFILKFWRYEWLEK